MIVYELGPIDAWYGWTPFEEALAKASQNFEEQLDSDFNRMCAIRPQELHDGLAKARRLAKLLGDDVEDLREGPYFAPLPHGGGYDGAFLLAWKRDANGITFVASPYRLPWLDKEDNRSIDSEDSETWEWLGTMTKLLRRHPPGTPGSARAINRQMTSYGEEKRGFLRMALNELNVPFDRWEGIDWL
jgi:hypothetical protein